MKNRAKYILETFQELGLMLDPASRIAKQADFFLDRKGTLPQIIEPSHELTETARETFRDINQIAFSLKQLFRIIPNEELKKHVRLLIKDNVLPQDSSDRSPGRDKQCEIFVAGLCARANLKPSFKEPDLHCELSEQTFGVAIKRLKSWDLLKDRIRYAAKQIKRSALPGIIIADVSQALNPTNLRMPMEVSDDQLQVGMIAARRSFRNDYKQRLFEWTRGEGVRGVIFLDHLVRCCPNGEWQMILMATPINLSETNQRRCREFELFSSRFDSAVDDPGPA